jgi:hypothetical protein
MDKGRTILHTFLTKYTRPFLAHLMLLAFHNDKDKKVYKNDDNFDRLWKISEVLDILNVVYSKFYNPSEHLATNEMTVLFKGKVAFKLCISKKHKCLGIKIYKLCDPYG